jgi:hypothetical protein
LNKVIEERIATTETWVATKSDRFREMAQGIGE